METITTPIDSKELQSQVMQLLNWSEEQFAHFVYETGLAYLNAYFIDDTAAVNLLSSKKEFWNWFKNHWSYRDQVFVETFLLCESPFSFMIDMYECLHCPQQLVCEIYPSRTVLGKEFFQPVKTLKNVS